MDEPDGPMAHPAFSKWDIGTGLSGCGGTHTTSPLPHGPMMTATSPSTSARMSRLGHTQRRTKRCDEDRASALARRMRRRHWSDA